MGALLLCVTMQDSTRHSLIVAFIVFTLFIILIYIASGFDSDTTLVQWLSFMSGSAVCIMMLYQSVRIVMVDMAGGSGDV